MSAAAFFDLDRTVVAGSSVFYFGRAALKWGLYSRRRLVADAVRNRAFRRRGASDEQNLEVRDRLLAAVEGRRRTDIDAMTLDVLAPILTRVYPDMYRRILDHQDDGLPTVLCSAAPTEIVTRVSQALNMQGALGTKAELDADGVYTGALDGPFCYAIGKVHAMRTYAREHGIDLSESWAYSDSASDLPMLEAVGHPVAVNPDKGLEAVAIARGWEILRPEPKGLPRVVTAGVLAGFALAAAGAIWWSARRSPPPPPRRVPSLWPGAQSALPPAGSFGKVLPWR